MSRIRLRCAADQRGSIMVLALGFMVVLLVIAAGVHAAVLNQLRGSGALRQRTAAYALAEGGIARAMAWFNATNYQLPGAATLTETVPVKLLAGLTPIVLPSSHPNAYTDSFGQGRSGVVTSFNQYLTNQSGAVGNYSVVSSLMAQSPETWEIIATATVGGTTRQVGAVLIREQNALFGDALFGRDSVAMSGNGVIDSYDSSAGAYGGSNVFQTGNVRSNGDIGLSGNATVRGDAMAGPDRTVSTSGNASVTGSKQSAPSAKQLPAPSVPALALAVGAISLSGNNTRTLIAGNYLASSLSISGNGSLIIDSTLGPVNLYVSGDISISGNGINNVSGVPSKFNLVSTGTAGVSFSGNANFSGTVYAPGSELNLTGNGTMYGAFVGARMRVSGNGAIHYDKVLKTITGVPGPIRLMAQWNAPS
jgi:Tfp pilus assembly protein PilX